ncbi:MAG: AfsR/SARP family transcriptional regulator [Actinomycetota bacterium]
MTVFGPATIGGVDVTPAQRALIAALALAGPSGADIGTLADAVWSGRPPKSARASLQNQMTRLRRTHGEDLIVCEQARYRLGRATDVERFETLVDSASSNDAATIVERLEVALAHWRGVPFEDVDAQQAHVERARLGERRAAAIERLTLARFDLGTVDAVVLDLRVEVERDPFRDRNWELLVIALHRSGRRAEALLVLDDHARRLRHEFGTAPSSRMADLGDLIRTGEVVLGGPSHHAAADAHRPRSARRCRVRPHRGYHRAE